MNKLMKNRKIYVIALAVLFVFVSLSETTYSLFLHSDSTGEFNYNTGLLDLTFIEDERIILENAFPINDSEALKSEPYVLTIKNTGSLPYLFNLKMVNEDNNSIDTRYIKVKVNNNLPHTLSYTDNTIASSLIIYPNEEMTFNINVWLDINTPNNELGKKFSAKVVTSGSSIYKTLDESGANYPKLNSDMLPVYYDESSNDWHLADRTNLKEDYLWYNYDNQRWANSITIKNSDKQIYDITRNNDLKISDIKYNNGNAVIEENYLDINLSNYNYNNISNIFRIKFNDLNANRIYILTNGHISYYYDNISKTFVFKNGNNTVSSSTYNLEIDKWYILGYTYDKNKVNFYIDGNKLSTSNIGGNISTGSSFKIGTNDSLNEISKITVGDILIYNRILTDNEISKNYKTSIQIIYDGLLSGYDEFIPMTLKEYYLSKTNGFNINYADISSFYVWIPRYKYRVWNITGETNEDTYDAYNKGIDISFENNTTSSGVIYCENTECYSDSLKITKVTSEDNNKYYTHPAFSNTDEELTGLWVSKYEVSITNDNIESKYGNTVSTNTYLSDYYQNIKNISNDNNYHVIKNTEWGSIAYLSHSKYGLCPNNKCQAIVPNSTKISGSEIKDSTTGNIYGVFDTSGSANEYTMGNVTTDNNLNLNNSLFKDIPLSTDDYDLYQENTFILGDATKEFTTNELTNSWIIRNDLFSYSTSDDIMNNNLTTRIVTK